MKPVVTTMLFADGASQVIPLNHYGEVGVAYACSVAAIVKPLANKADTTSDIATIASAVQGSFLYPADGLLVTITADTVFTHIQYGT